MNGKEPHTTEKKASRFHQRKAALMESLRNAHEMDHEILEALGIKHPHVPILSVVEILEHLRGRHVDETDQHADSDSAR